jgi:hypothetical protein
MADELITSGETKNSYGTIEEAVAYFESRLGAAAWTNASDDEQIAAMRMAYRNLERITMWRGAPAQPTQAGKWPRNGVYRTRKGGLYADESLWPVDLVPPQVVQAQFEEALALLEQETDSAASKRRVRQRQGVAGVSLTGLSEQWGPPPRYAQGNLVSAEAYGLIREFLALGGTLKIR